MKCPKCGLFNTSESAICDCGFNLRPHAGAPSADFNASAIADAIYRRMDKLIAKWLAIVLLFVCIQWIVAGIWRTLREEVTRAKIIQNATETDEERRKSEIRALIEQSRQAREEAPTKKSR